MARNIIPLNHLAHIVGHIGRVQTISVIPVIAGDSLDIHIDGVLRLAPFRKEIVSECQVDVCAFFVPHRHIYGAEWLDAVTKGLQSSTTLSAGPAVAASDRDCFFLGIKQCGATVNKALIAGYNGIMQRYFAVPTSEANQNFSFTTDYYRTAYPSGATSNAINSRKYGYLAGRLPHILNDVILTNNTANVGGYTRTYTNADWGVQIPQDTPSAGIALLDIRDLQQIKSRYKSIQDQNYFDQFYTDVVANKWQTQGVNADADPRPTYLGRDTHFISGHDIDGTDDATLGTYVGKTIDRISFRLQRRFMPEHGNVWIMILPRFPLVHTKEQHPLLATSQPNNQLLLADPEVWAGEPTVAYDPGQWLAGGSLWTPDVTRAQHPYGQEYRYQPNRIHPVFEQIPGYPFTSWDASTATDWLYYKDNEFQSVFDVSQVQQWQLHANINCRKYSSIVDPRTSIFAGGN